MKINLNNKDNTATITLQSLNDLFSLYLLIEKGDELYGYSYRQEKFSTKEGEKVRGEKKRIFLGIKVEKIYFHKFSNALRVIGPIIEKPDDFEIEGHFHSFGIKVGDTILLKKSNWDSVIIKSILKNISEVYPDTLIVAIDYDEIAIGKLEKYDLKILYEKKENLGGKRYENGKLSIENFIKRNSVIVVDYINKVKPKIVILYGPSIFKEILYEQIKSIDINIYKVSGSSGGIEGLYESLRNEEVLKILALNTNINNFFLSNLIQKEYEKLAIGLEEIKEISVSNAIDKLLISTKILKESDLEKLDLIKNIAENVSKQGGEIHIIFEDSELGEMLEKLGNIVAILRYKLK
jgi:Predicted RNA-binding proteins